VFGLLCSINNEVEGYGLSEATCGSTINPVAGPRRAGTVGFPFPGQEIRIVDADGSEVAPGADGEVVVRGPNVMRGYLGRPDETPESSSTAGCTRATWATSTPRAV
jgi:long-subunit acyl-CoA synthetase (AMP-forming)